MNNSNRIIAVVIGVLVVIAIGLLIWKESGNNTNLSTQTATTTPIQSATSTDISTTATIPTSTGSMVSGGTQTVTVNGNTSNEPSLNRPLPNTSGLDAALVAQTEASMQVTIANLNANPNSFNDWLALGQERKDLGDYDGAVLAWNYAGELYPTNIVSFGNLADLYTNFLKNNTLAEQNYLIEIKNNPTGTDAYTNLYHLYISEGNTDQAIAILQQGIQTNPNVFDFDVLLARYYRSVGNNTSAKQYYSAAITLAQNQGNVNEENSLQTESAGL